MSNITATILIESDDSTLKSKARGNRQGAIQLLETTTTILRKEEGKAHLKQNLPTALRSGQILSEALNAELYKCECGRAFPTQNGYAGHQNHCEYENQ